MLFTSALVIFVVFYLLIFPTLDLTTKKKVLTYPVLCIHGGNVIVFVVDIWARFSCFLPFKIFRAENYKKNDSTLLNFKNFKMIEAHYIWLAWLGQIYCPCMWYAFFSLKCLSFFV